MCKIMLANRMWAHDQTCPVRPVYLCNAAALDQVKNGLVDAGGIQLNPRPQAILVYLPGACEAALLRDPKP